MPLAMARGIPVSAVARNPSGSWGWRPFARSNPAFPRRPRWPRCRRTCHIVVVVGVGVKKKGSLSRAEKGEVTPAATSWPRQMAARGGSRCISRPTYPTDCASPATLHFPSMPSRDPGRGGGHAYTTTMRGGVVVVENGMMGVVRHVVAVVVTMTCRSRAECNTVAAGWARWVWPWESVNCP